MGLIEQTRSSWKETLRVKEEKDLPYVLLTEVLNQSVLRGATAIEVTYDGRSISVKDNAAPFEDRLESLLHYSIGMMNEDAARLYHLTDRQWGARPYAVINALCREFSLVSGSDEGLRSVVCEDGEVVSTSSKKVFIGNHNVVSFQSFVGMESIMPGFLRRLLEYIEPLFPQVTIIYNTSVEEEENEW